MPAADLPAGAAGPTPGPWGHYPSYTGEPNTFEVGPDEFDTVAHVRLGSDDVEGDCEANAKLIAAVPHLAAACEAMLALLMDGTLVLGSADPVTEQCVKIFAMRALLSAGIDFGPRRHPFAAMEALASRPAAHADGGGRG